MKGLGPLEFKMSFSRMLPLRVLALGLAVSCLFSAGCTAPGTATPPFAGGADSKTERVERQQRPGTSHDLTVDERAGGHTLRKHVGRTDDELRERLAQEQISASSTYIDRAAAEFAIGNALQEGQYRIEKWQARSGSHPNLVLDYHGDQPIGRTMHRGDSASQPCSDAKVVLRWLSPSEYYVLTSYPECR